MTKTAGSPFVLLVIAVALGAGCKGKTKEIDRPETLAALHSCEENLKAKVEYADSLNRRIDEFEQGGAIANPDDSAVVITIEGEVMTIASGRNKGPSGGSGVAKGAAKDEELYAAFVKQLKRSRRSIKKCYQAALKKDVQLSTRTISLNIQVNYNTDGKVRNAKFSPNVSTQFNACMDSVANNWVLPAMPRSVTFNYKQNLTPE